MIHPQRMKKSILRNIIAGGALLLLLAALYLTVTGGWGSLARGSTPLILEIDLEEPLPETSDSLLAGLGLEEPLSLRGAIEALERATHDRRVKVLVARINAGQAGLAGYQELRDAIVRFRSSGKRAIAFAETFGEVAPSNGSYYLATAFDEIYLQPTGDLGLTGLRAESQFFRGTYDKLGVTPRGGHRHEYKNALNAHTEKEFTPAHRESLESLLTSQYSQIVRGISERRRIAEPQLRELINGGPYLAKGALDSGLVDGLLYRDEAYAKARAIAGSNSDLLYLHKYRKREGGGFDKGTQVAVITGAGPVQRGKSDFNLLSNDTIMGSDTVTAAFRAAADDDKVKAIIFRVDCPGGSVVASDAILREAGRARKNGKPVIVSMGNLGASGGYYVALDADRIIAQPGTITGSIGVVRLKLLTRDFWKMLGITYGEVETARNASMWSSLADFSPEQETKFNAWLDHVYSDFTAKVAAARRLPIERVREIAKGRVWTGEQALELGLIDDLGGWHTSIAAARSAAGLKVDAPVKLVDFPKKQSLLEKLLKTPRNSDHAKLFAQSAAALRPIIGLAKQLGIYGPPPGVVQMTDFEITH
jgi:protease-4